MYVVKLEFMDITHNANDDHCKTQGYHKRENMQLLDEKSMHLDKPELFQQVDYPLLYCNSRASHQF